MPKKIFVHEYDLDRFQIIKPRNHDFRLLVAPRLVQHYRENLYEEFTGDLLVTLLDDGSLFVDVGAHYGYYASLVGTKWPGCRIMAFEPVPENFEALKRNAVLNRLKGIELRNLTISDRAGVSSFKIVEASDMCGFYDHPLARTCKEIQVQTERLDSFLVGISSCPTVVKIDTEGHELRVLAGMTQFLRDAGNAKLIVEFNPGCLRQAGCEPQEFLEEIHGLGFEIQVIVENKRLLLPLRGDDCRRWADYLPEGDEGRYTNLLCVKRTS